MSTPVGGPGGPIPSQPTTQLHDPNQGRYAGGAATPAPTGHDDGPGMAERAQYAAQNFARHIKTPETKEFFKTSEFLVWALTAVGILIAATTISGDNDQFLADEAWRYITIVSAAYIISRGISKAGTRRGHGDAPMDHGHSGHGGF